MHNFNEKYSFSQINWSIIVDQIHTYPILDQLANQHSVPATLTRDSVQTGAYFFKDLGTTRHIANSAHDKLGT